MNPRKKNVDPIIKGMTAVGLIWFLWVVAYLFALITLFLMAVHFIAKFW